MTGTASAAIDLDEIETPIGYVDLERAASNAASVVAYASSHGLRWRPHIKTHKSLTIARIQLAAGAAGLTVATLREAEVMSTVTDDLLLAYPPVGRAKLERLMRLPDTVDLKVALDSLDVVKPLAEIAAGEGRRIGVLIEEDVGMGRVGLPDADAVVALARAVSELDGVDFRGVMFYPGHIRTSAEAQAQGLARVAERVEATLSALRAVGLEPEIVSGGSTPTLWQSHAIPGVTEIRSGSCIFFDREGLDLGVVDRDQLAYTVLATVVSTAVDGQAVVDAGSKALAKESRGGGGGFGVVLDRPEVTVKGLSEEHGVLDVAESSWRPVVGERVRIVPNHVCVSVNLQDRLLGVRDGAHEMVSLEGRGRERWTG